MSNNPCLSFFTYSARPTEERGPFLQAMPIQDVLAWEKLHASDFSKHPVVDNNETLYRQLYDPTHWDNINKTFSPSAFNDASTRGLSVNRIELSDFSHLVTNGHRSVAKWNMEHPDKPQRMFLGFAPLSCLDLRSIYYPESANDALRIFAIFDTALEEDPSHADVFRLGHPDFKKDGYKRITRRKLWDTVKNKIININGELITNSM